MIRARFIVMVALAAAMGCGQQSNGPSSAEGPFVRGAADDVHQLWFAGQLDRAGFEAAKETGIDVVINLRAPSELDWDEAAAVESLGMAYYNVPVVGPSFDPGAFAEIERLVEEHPGQQTLIHCSSSNRAGGWFATHLVDRHEMSLDDALAAGRATGITKDAIVTRVREYLERSADS
jgi:protein tyrosine phosphatase (PTP) superfamily phosphohydrolase (DUF442 family)